MGSGCPSPDRGVCCTARPADRQLQQEGKLPFQLQGAYVSLTLGLSGSPVSKLCPGRSNKTPRLLRHGHSSCLGRPFPSKETPEINGKRFIRGWVVSSLPPPAAPLLASLSFLSEQAASTKKQPRFFQTAGWDLIPGGAGRGSRAPQTLLFTHSFLGSLTHLGCWSLFHSHSKCHASAWHILDTVAYNTYKMDKSRCRHGACLLGRKTVNKRNN